MSHARAEGSGIAGIVLAAGSGVWSIALAHHHISLSGRRLRVRTIPRAISIVGINNNSQGSIVAARATTIRAR